MKTKAIVIVGPTASGKSALAVELARTLKGEVISADSRQVYTSLNIGTGKITKREMKGVPHHLLDIASPKKVFTAQHFTTKGQKAIAEIIQRGKVPIICGGTGFYIDALLGRIPLPHVAPNPNLRRMLQKKNAPQLFTQLKRLDPERAASIDKNNPVRLIRAIEIAKKLGKVPAMAQADTSNVLWIGLTIEKKVLHTKIHSRLRARMKQGMVNEAKSLHRAGLSYKRMEALGLEYRYLARFLQNTITRPQMLEELEHEIRHYAKRQMTYWKRNSEIIWCSPAHQHKITSLAKKFLK